MNLPLIVGVVFLMFGFYLLTVAINRYKKAKLSLRWPSVTGCLTEVKLWGPRLVDGKTIDAEKIAVEYTYEVNGVKHSSYCPCFYTMVYPETLDFARRHVTGSEIPIYYNPQNPAEAVIIKGLHKQKPYSDLILGIIAVCAGGAVVLLASMQVIG